METKGGRKAHIVVDLTFGDAGKGTITDWLARTRPVRTVIRFNGGAQAGHNVVTPDGRHHTFSQFGSATFVPGVRTHLSSFMILNPLSMLVEERRLAALGVTDAFKRTTISAESLVITPFQRAANRLREISRGEGRHGSCGMGIGETAMDAQVVGRTAVRAGDLLLHDEIRRKLGWLQSYKRGQMRDTIERCRTFPVAAEEIRQLEDESVIEAYLGQLSPFLHQATITADGFLRKILEQPGDVVFEGAQGVLIDEWRGFDPYTTWSTCTFKNALDLLGEHGYDGAIDRIGVVRAYATRHGPGPFVTEDAGLGKAIPDMYNRMDDWQRNFRVGWFDAVATRYAIAACGGVDALAVTGFDRLRDIPEWRICNEYRLRREDGDDLDRFFVNYTAGSSAWVSGIRLGPERDLSHQTALTGLLMKARPLCSYVMDAAEPFEKRVERHINELSAALKVPVRVASFGPAADDKRSY